MEAKSAKIRVLIADDHELIRDGISATIARQADMTVVGHASDGAQAVDLAGKLHPDVVLMDLQMPGMNGMDAIAAIRRAWPDTGLLVLSTFGGDFQMARAMSRGANGYLIKEDVRDDLVDAIRTVHARPPASSGAHNSVRRDAMSVREREILRKIAQGESNDDIAWDLRVSPNTVRADVRRVLRKLGARDRTQALVIAIQLGIVDP